MFSSSQPKILGSEWTLVRGGGATHLHRLRLLSEWGLTLSREERGSASFQNSQALSLQASKNRQLLGGREQWVLMRDGGEESKPLKRKGTRNNTASFQRTGKNRQKAG